MSLFNFDQLELLTFFAVLVRYSVLTCALPVVGDHNVPMPVKILLSLAVSIALFPALLAGGHIRPSDAAIWGSSPSGIIGTITTETVFALVLGFVARLAFQTIDFGGNLVGNLMGYGIANTYDPSQESQTQVVAQLQMAIATLIFLVLDGHHLMLRATLQSYDVVGIGGLGALKGFGFNHAFAARIAELTGEMIRVGLQISAPIAIALFGVNLIFGILAKAMPQLNILILSVSVSAILGLAIMLMTVPEFHAAAANVFGGMGVSLAAVMRAMKEGK